MAFNHCVGISACRSCVCAHMHACVCVRERETERERELLLVEDSSITHLLKVSTHIGLRLTLPSQSLTKR